MARISEQEIERLKTEVSLLRLVESQGIALKKHGKDYLGLCPFHDDREPSLVISPDKNLWHCLGACDEGGDVIQWVMKRQGVSFRHAVALLRDGNPALTAPLSGEGKPSRRNTTTKHPNPLAADPDDQAMLRRVIDYYHETLKQSPEALEYLERRGLAHPELIGHFRLGYANRTLGYRLPEKSRKAGAEVRGQLQKLGLLRPSGHEHFSGSLVIPVISPDGLITEVYGRKIRDDLRKGTAYHLYLPGPHAGVFNEAALAAIDEVILCESLIDALTFWAAGYRNVTASYGTSGFTEAHLAAFRRHGIKRVLIAYDRDDAGNTAAEKLAEKLTAEGSDGFRVLLPKGMDANAYASQVKPAQKSLGVALRSAKWLGSGQAPAITTSALTEAGEPIDPETGEILTLAQSTAGPEDPTETDSPLAAEPSLCEPTQASPQPAPAPDIEAEVAEHEVNMSFGDRHYRIRGLARNTSYEQLKVNVLVRRGETFHVDGLDMYAAKHRAAYVKQASVELGLKEDIIKRDLGRVLLKLEALQEESIKRALAPEKVEVALTDAEQQAALALLKAPDLLARILADFERCGVVGEATNTLVGYLACVSRKLDRPLAVILQSTSAAGKSALMEAVLALMPEEERIQYSAMTGQSLFYLGEQDLKHKILAIAEEEGVREASYALKLLQSQGELTIASTGKDATTGKLVTQEYRVEGPVMLFLTTTAIDLDEELKNRCLVLTVNETRAQTQAIQDRQRFEETLAGLLAAQDRDAVLDVHRNAQRLLRPLKVVNPYAEQLTFLADKTRTRRDHKKYLALIRAIALLHQYQRPVKTVQHNGSAVAYIEVQLDDIETANRLAHEVLGRTLDELPPQTRRLLQLIHQRISERCQALEMAQADYRFSRREVREYVGWTEFQVRTHINRLVALEYLLVHRGGRGQSFVYELLYDGQDRGGEPHLCGLIDAVALRGRYDANCEGREPDNEVPSSPQRAPDEVATRGGRNDQTTSHTTTSNDEGGIAPEITYPGAKKEPSSYRADTTPLAASSTTQNAQPTTAPGGA